MQCRLPMSQTKAKSPSDQGADLVERCGEGVAAAERLLHHASAGVRARVGAAGDLDAAQAAAHGLAWLATYVEALRQMQAWAARLAATGRLGRAERLLLACAFGEYLAQMAGGIPMSQGETTRPISLGVARAAVRRFEDAV